MRQTATRPRSGVPCKPGPTDPRRRSRAAAVDPATGQHATAAAMTAVPVGSDCLSRSH
ncbi:hypothetical protein CBM2615_A60044 [Cupriavidus taiwanensis]|uniref:Uncharacterized protein n=1 Tax=Cupriavidus taiwanensis TaxID=164546 RepID=A0A976G366_9BURK|nr:hypothetical protein CBM2615_A60044 [Cupriavidus taiwanensis]SOZ60051.1 hypothetical protein CBM2614_A60043 [Cupriavidus taiwanensis]SOZ63712.1 hypothetical protein CBM2613_A50043 [Cupriavidus taiwanensis]